MLLFCQRNRSENHLSFIWVEWAQVTFCWRLINLHELLVSVGLMFKWITLISLVSQCHLKNVPLFTKHAISVTNFLHWVLLDCFEVNSIILRTFCLFLILNFSHVWSFPWKFVFLFTFLQRESNSHSSHPWIPQQQSLVSATLCSNLTWLLTFSRKTIRDFLQQQGTKTASNYDKTWERKCSLQCSSWLTDILL